MSSPDGVCRGLVSVLLPAFNAEATIERAIRSIQTQSLQDFELVVVDDGSTDATPMILSRLAMEDRRIRNLRTSHRGIAAALNTGLHAVCGEFVARMDADDVSLPRRLELQRRHLLRNAHLGLVGSRVCFGGNRRKCGGYAQYVDWTNSLLSSYEISLHRFVESPLVHPSVMFRRSVVDRFGGYRGGDFPEDYELWLRWFDRGVRAEKLPAVLLSWKDSARRLSRVDQRYAVDRFYSVKSRYLARWLETSNPFHPEVWLIGSGRTTRRRVRPLEECGICVSAYVDIDPRKIGRSIQGRPVIARDQIPTPGTCFLLSYVGSRGAREDIQAFLQTRGYQLGRDFLIAA